MNWLIAILSFISVLYFAIPELLNSNAEQSNGNSKIAALVINESMLHPGVNSALLTQLQKEADALKQQALAEQKTAQQKDKPKVGQNELVFGDEVFNLLGIFNQQNSVFVIIKNNQQQLVKATIGDTLGGDVKLTAVTNNTITLANATQSKEFKLFQRQSHE